MIRAAGISTARIAAVGRERRGAADGDDMGARANTSRRRMEQYAREMKTFEKFQRLQHGAAIAAAWAKDGDTIFSVQQQSAGNSYGGVYVFKFDAQRRLRSIGTANSASIDASNRWQLSDYRESRIEEDRIVPSRRRPADLETNLSAEFLGLAAVKPDSMPVRALFSYVAAPQAQRSRCARRGDGASGRASRARSRWPSSSYWRCRLLSVPCARPVQVRAPSSAS